jgi:Topoisomerase IB
MVHADTAEPSITRRKCGRGWMYVRADGKRITDRQEIDRLNAIGLPPAYVNTWFASDPRSHVLATGIDAKGRKQYIYHADHVAQSSACKFRACASFGDRLPRIRAVVEKELARRVLSRERAVASIIRLLDSGRIRVGSEAYARANKSFGATTLRQRHARLKGDRLALRFRAKSGKDCSLSVSDRGLIRFVKQVQDLPGQHLFQYKGEDGEYRPVSSGDVNAYIHQTMGEAFTAKDFRTWAASVLALEWLAKAEGRVKLREMLAHVAEHLGNTPAVARNSYIHPALIDVAQNRDVTDFPGRLPRRTKWLSGTERFLIDFLAAWEG